MHTRTHTHKRNCAHLMDRSLNIPRVLREKKHCDVGITALLVHRRGAPTKGSRRSYTRSSQGTGAGALVNTHGKRASRERSRQRVKTVISDTELTAKAFLVSSLLPSTPQAASCCGFACCICCICCGGAWILVCCALGFCEYADAARQGDSVSRSVEDSTRKSDRVS